MSNDMKTYLECIMEAADTGKWKVIDRNALYEIMKYLSPMLSEAADIYAEQSNSHKHGVMQAEGSDGAKGAAVGNSAAGQSGSCGHLFERTDEGIQCIYCKVHRCDV